MTTDTNCCTGGTCTELRAVEPASDIYRHDDGYTLHLDVPGVADNEIEIEANAEHLEIRARNDRRHYHRRFRIDERIDRGNITAELRHGVLTLRLPLGKPAVTRIAISS